MNMQNSSDEMSFHGRKFRRTVGFFASGTIWSLYPLREQQMIEITVRHFQLKKIAESGQCFRYGIPAAGGYLTAYQPNEGTLQLDCTRKAYDTYWCNYLGLRDDYDLFFEAAVEESGTYLYKAAVAADGVRILTQDLWETMVSFLVSQNNNLPRITKTIARMCECLGRPQRHADGTLYYAFPEPEALLDCSVLRKLGLGYRDKYIASLASDVQSQRIDLKALRSMTTSDVCSYLKNISGIGEKVANCIMLFGLHRLEAFPVDVWIRRIINEQYGGCFPLERFEGFAGVIQQFIFYYAQHQKTEDSLKKTLSSGEKAGKTIEFSA